MLQRAQKAIEALRGAPLPEVEAVFTFAAAVYNLVRLPKLLAGAAA